MTQTSGEFEEDFQEQLDAEVARREEDLFQEDHEYFFQGSDPLTNFDESRWDYGSVLTTLDESRGDYGSMASE